eukprot:TRINITY_DN2852_c1_g1_i1.p1 TRINITY_DN2852_c1_g1~~TRINITY_DN2852_c1_g1_i1.p1  ORF type:complete len:318 (+),score=65.69 TRINITY_DN2852_c1_g1_i1:116-1069(+)
MYNLQKHHWAVCFVALLTFVSFLFQKSEYSFLPDSSSRLALPDGQLERMTEELEFLRRTVYEVEYDWSSCMKLQHRKNCTEHSRDDPTSIPCRAEILFDLVVEVDKALTDAGILHWYAFGTLLGAIRNQKIIPWTADADLIYMRENGTQSWFMLDVVPKVQQALLRKGILVFLEKGEERSKYDPPGWGRACIATNSKKYAPFRIWERPKYWFPYEHDFPYLDMFSGKTLPNSSNLVRVWPFSCRFDLRYILPVGHVKLYDTMITAPRQPHRTSLTAYGPDYMLPPDSLSGHGDRKQECSKEYLEMAANSTEPGQEHS